MSDSENQNPRPDCPTDCLGDCLTPAERRRAILGPEIIAEIDAAVDAAPEPTPEVVEKLRRIMTNPGGKPPAPLPACKPFTFADAEATFGPDWEAVRRRTRGAPRIRPGQNLCSRRLFALFGQPEPEA
ncbi:hypothetical protein ACWEPI_08375 [Streptomyces sp. NPDC004262]